MAECAVGGTISTTRQSTNQIIIPRFNPGIGTLTDVELTVTLLGGTTNSGPSHSHTADPPPFQTGFFGAVGVQVDIPAFTTASSGVHNHGVSVPQYSGNGLTIPSFNFSTFSASPHSHSVNFPPTAIGIDGTLNIPATSTLSVSTPSHSFSNQSQVLNFSGGGLTPFVGFGDFSISTGSLTTNSAGTHTHAINPPAVNVPPFGFVNLPQFNSAAAGGHTQTITPTWRTETVFTYIPEPCTAVLAGLGLTGLVLVPRRRRTGRP